MSKKKSPVCSKRSFPPITVAADGCAVVEQARIPAEVEALEAALSLAEAGEKYCEAYGLKEIGDKFAFAAWTVKKALKTKRRRASTGGNAGDERRGGENLNQNH